MLRHASHASAAALLFAVCAVAPFGAEAQSYRCVGKDGKKYYGQTIPRQCIGQTVEQLNAQGTVIRRIEHETKEEKAARAAAEKKRREAMQQDREEARRNRALLATYTSEADIEAARKRALAENQEAVKEVNQRIAEIKKRQAQLQKELEFYKGKNDPPAKLTSDIKTAKVDLEAQENLLEVKKKEVESINAKYDEDKKRFLELTKAR
jgi:hypothetical protein